MLNLKIRQKFAIAYYGIDYLLVSSKSEYDMVTHYQ